MNRSGLKVTFGLAALAGAATIGARAQAAWGQSQEAQVITVPKSYGTLKAVSAGDGGPIFEAPDGTIRYVSLVLGGKVALTIRRQ